MEQISSNKLSLNYQMYSQFKMINFFYNSFNSLVYTFKILWMCLVKRTKIEDNFKIKVVCKRH